MNQGWIATYASTEAMAPQISFASQGGSGTPVPALSIEVDDLDEALRRVKAMGLAIEVRPLRYGVYAASMFAIPSAVW
jgi:hypothetical protein